MRSSDFGRMYRAWGLMTQEERVARMIAFRAWEPPPGTPLATAAALTKSYADEHWLEYLETAREIVREVRGGVRKVG